MTYEQTITASLWIDAGHALGVARTCVFGLGFDNKLYVLSSETPADMTPSATRRIPKLPYKYELLIVNADGEKSDQIALGSQAEIYRFVQPLGNEEILCVRARSGYRSRGGPKNAHVFSKDGSLRREIDLGDGIAHVMTTVKGDIWVGYFDEGVFGDDPNTMMGLNRWDKDGNLIYRYSPPDGLSPIYDCYALNVASTNDVWAYYYDEFRLLHIQDDAVLSIWECPVRGARAFAVLGEKVLFAGGYYDPVDKCYLFRLNDVSSMSKVGALKVVADDKTLLTTQNVIAQANVMGLIRDNSCYRIDMATV